MAISETLRRSPLYFGNGSTTEFAFHFKVFKPEHLLVLRFGPSEPDAGTELTLGEEYDVELSNDPNEPGGKVVFGTAPSGSVRIRILSGQPFDQTLTLFNQGPYFAEDVMGALDRNTILTQQLREWLLRTPSLPPGDDETDPQELFTIVQNSAQTAQAAADAAAGSATTAGDAATTAIGARDKAEEWADNDEDVEVEPGRFSAFHWAQKAQGFAEGDATNISYDNTASGLEATDVQDALDEAEAEAQAHYSAEGGIHGIPEGERALHTGANGGGTPIGGYVTVQSDLTGAEEPDPASHIKLEAGLTGAGGYNEGKLDNEYVSGSAPLVEATAEIVDAESPLNGQTVHLLETERRFLRAGNAGTVENDQMQRITGRIQSNGFEGLFGTSIQDFTIEGAFSLNDIGGDRRDGSRSGDFPYEMLFNSADSPDARVSETTDGESRPKNIGVSVYMRIK